MTRCCLCGEDGNVGGGLIQIEEGKAICLVCMDTIMASYYTYIAFNPKEEPCEFEM